MLFFNTIHEKGEALRAACWAHARRKFVEIHKAHASPLAAQAIRRIGALYEIERDPRGRSPNERAAKQDRSGAAARGPESLLRQLGSLSKE